MGEPTFNYTTKLWKRSQNSHATTVPKQILAIKGAPVSNAQVEWEIDPESGDVVVQFTEANDE